MKILASGKKEDTAEIDAEKDAALRYSKNLIPYNNVSQFFEGTLPIQTAAFQYGKAEGVPEKMGDWILNFYLPFSDADNPDITYTCEYKIYRLYEEKNENQEETTAEEEGIKTELRKWVADGNPRIEIFQEITEEYEGVNPDFPKAIFFPVRINLRRKNTVPEKRNSYYF